MRKVKSVKLKPGFVTFIKFIGVILCILLGLFIFYSKQISDLTKLGYSKEASKNILFSWKKDYVMSIGENKTLNEAFISSDYDENNLDHYSKIKYFEHKHLIKNINTLLKQGYSNNEINIILSHGTDESVSEFAKRKKIRYLEEFFSVDYAKLENYDRYVNYSDETGEDEETTVLFVNLDLDKEDYVGSKEVNEFSSSMLVNKHRNLTDSFEPSDLMTIPSEYASEDDFQASRIAFNAYKKMSDAASNEGYEIVINSAYRSYSDQEELIEFYKNAYGQSYVDKYVAKAGYSEHQTGLAFDIGSRKVNVFADSKEYEWMQDNAYKYGFILRFSKKYEGITGFRSEPWHYRYVGVEAATYIHEHRNIPYEYYYAMFLDK